MDAELDDVDLEGFDQRDLVAGLRELEDASGAYRTAMAYYLNEEPEKFATQKTGNLIRSGNNYRVNVARCPVDAVTDRLTIRSTTVLDSDGKTWPDAADALRTLVWEPNRMDRQFPRLIRDTSIYGDGHLYYWRSDNEARPVELAFNSPLLLRVIYDPEDELTPLFAVKRWTGLDGSDNANLITDTEVIRYVLDEHANGKWQDPGSWIEVGRETHGFGEIPVRHFSTWIPYGRPEHRDAYGPQNAVNKLAPTMVDAAEEAGYPARYALATADASIRGDRPDTLDYDDTDTQDMASGDALPSKLKTGPGEVALLEGFTGAGQWASATSNTFIDGANWFIRAEAQSTTTPLHMLDPGGSTPSGESRRIADAPLEVKVKLRRDVYGADLAATLEACLASLGYAGAQVRVKWDPSPVADDTLTWTVCTEKIAAGVPVRVALLETGLYDEDEIDQWFDEDGRGQFDLSRQVDVLNRIASAIQGLGQGVALGILSQDRVDQIVERIIGQAAGDEPDASDEPGPPDLVEPVGDGE